MAMNSRQSSKSKSKPKHKSNSNWLRRPSWLQAPEQTPADWQRRALFEPLEDRALLSVTGASLSDVVNTYLKGHVITGATVLTSGFQLGDSVSDGNSLMPLAQAIRNYADATTPTVSNDAWLLDYDVGGEGGTGQFDLSNSILPAAGTSEPGQLVVLFDWAPEASENSAGWGSAAGDALYSMVVGLGLANPEASSSVPLHFIGDGTGAAVTSDAVRRLAQYQVPVDQVTYLDPHDFVQPQSAIDSQQALYSLGEPQIAAATDPYYDLNYGVTTWNNVSFTDVYYETRGANGTSTSKSPDVPLGRPIPGAYNVLLTGSSQLPVVTTGINPYSSYDSLFGDDSYVWDTFYLGTVLGSLPAGSPAPANFTNWTSTGFAFSALAGGQTLRAQATGNFYSAGQDQTYSPPALFSDVAKTLPNLTELKSLGFSGSNLDQQFNTFQWNPSPGDLESLDNGDFQDPGDEFSAAPAYPSPLNTLVTPVEADNLVPGWSDQGGGGEGRVATDDGSNYYLVLDANGVSRTHNAHYIPVSAAELQFDLQPISVSSNDSLDIEIGSTVVATLGSTLPLDVTLGPDGKPAWQRDVTVTIPGDLRGATNTITFALVSSSGAVSSTVHIDNVQFVRGGSAGDVTPVSLPEINGGGTNFILDSSAVQYIDASGVAHPLTVVESTIRSDWQLVYVPDPNDPNSMEYLVGYVLFSDRIGAVLGPFDTTGKFYFAPQWGYARPLADQNSPWDQSWQPMANPLAVNQTEFQAKIRFGYLANNATTDSTVDLQIVPGYSDRGATAVPDVAQSMAASVANTAGIIALQQRLNYLGFTDDDGQPLVIDGIVGPHTEAALEFFKAVVDCSTTASPLTETSDLDETTVQWLNAPNAPQWTEYTATGSPAVSNGQGLNYGTSWLINTLATFNDPSAIEHLGPADPFDDSYSGLNSGYLDGMSVLINLPNSTQAAVEAVESEFAAAASANGVSIAEEYLETPTSLRIRILEPPLESISAGVANDLATGLSELEDRFNAIGQNDLLGKPLPLIGLTNTGQIDDLQSVSIDSILDLQDQISGMFAPAITYLQTTPYPTISGLQAALNANGVSGVTITSTMDPTSGDCGLQIGLDADYTQTQQDQTRDLELGQHARALGLTLLTSPNPTLNVTADANLAMDLNLDTSSGASLDNRFTVQVNQFTADVSASGSNMVFDMNQGLVNLHASGASFNMSATVAAENPNAPGTAPGLVTLAGLLTQPYSSWLVFHTTSGGTATGNLPITVDGFVAITDASIQLTSTNIFGQDPAYLDDPDPQVLITPDCLRTLINYTPNSIDSMMTSFGDDLDALTKSSLFTTAIPFSDGDTLGNELALKGLVDQDLTQLQDSSGNATFTTIQDYLTKIGATNIVADPASCTLTFDLQASKSHTNGPESLNLSQSSLGPLSNISTSSTGSEADSESMYVRVGIDFTELGSSFNLTPATLLSQVNGGMGVVQYNDVQIQLSDGTTYAVDLDLPTVGDVLTTLNALAPGKLSATLNASGTGINLTDSSQGTAGSFVVSPLNNSAVGAYGVGLGILGTASTKQANGSYVLYGTSFSSSPVTATTGLSELNGGNGVATSSQDDVEITLSDGTVLHANLDQGDIAGVLAVLNSLAPGKLAARINTDSKGIDLLDNSKGTAGPFSVTALNGSQAGLAGVGLGLLGSVSTPQANGTYLLSGSPLDNDTLADHFFLVANADLADLTLPSDPPGETGIMQYHDVQITLRNGTSLALDLNRQSVGDVLTALNNLMPGQLVATLNAASNGIDLTDYSSGSDSSNIVAINDSMAGYDLGLLGPDVGWTEQPDGSYVLHGTPLNGANTISVTTLLSALHGGAGVSRPTQADIQIKLSDGTTVVSANLDQNDMGGVIQELNSLAPGKLSAQLGADRREIVLTDLVKGGSEPVLSPLNGSTAWTDFGLNGAAWIKQSDGTYVLTGAWIQAGSDPLPFASHNPTIQGNATLTASSINAQATFGLANVAINNGNGSSLNTALLVLQDPNLVAYTSGRITLRELNDSLASLVHTGSTGGLVEAVSIASSANLHLPVSAQFNGTNLASNDAAIDVAWPDCTDPSTLAVTYEGNINNLESLSSLSPSDIVNALNDASSYLSSLNSDSFLNAKLPILNQSLNQLLDNGDKFLAMLQQFQSDPGSTLDEITQMLQSALASAMGTSVTAGAGGNTISLSFDSSNPAAPALELQIDLDNVFDQQMPLNLNLASLGLGTLASVGGNAMMDVTADANVSLNVGIDLSNPAAPRAFLYNTTNASITAKVLGQNLHFTAAVGPLDISIGNGGDDDGWVVLNGDGQLDSQPNASDAASLTVGLANADANGRLYFDQFTASDLTFSPVSGQVHLVLPVYKSDETTYLDPNQPDIDWNFDLTQIANPPPPTAPDFSAIVQNVTDLASSLNVMADGWNSFFGILDNALNSQIFSAKIPLIGSGLQKALTTFQEIQQSTTDALELNSGGAESLAYVQHQLWEALGPGGLDWLRAADGSNNAVQSDIHVIVDGQEINPVTNPPTDNPNEIVFDFHLHESGQVFQVPLDFALPALGLDLAGGVQVSTGMDFDVDFGVNKTSGVFLDTVNPIAHLPDALTFSITASLLPSTQLTGTLGALTVAAVDKGTSLTGSFAVKLKDPSGNGKLTLSELAGSSFSQVVSATFSGSANVKLGLTASFGSDADFPSITTDVGIVWDFANSSTMAPAASFGNAPVGEFLEYRVGRRRGDQSLCQTDP